MLNVLPISSVVPTRNRALSLKRMLESLALQSIQPAEIIVIDGSINDETQGICRSSIANLKSQIVYRKAERLGAATQRMQAMAYASQEHIWLLDDDITFEPDCLSKLWSALQSDFRIGGVSAMIINQQYIYPGRATRFMLRILHGRSEASYAGRCIGPAWNFLPEDNPSFPEVVPVEWLNSGCTLYRREALPQPLFPQIFSGYSMMEDVTLSLTVGKTWKLVNARTARIFHDSQPGDYKSNLAALSKMELINRHYVMTKVLGRTRVTDYLKLALHQSFTIAAHISSHGWRDVPEIIKGKFTGTREILFSPKSTEIV